MKEFLESPGPLLIILLILAIFSAYMAIRSFH